MNRTTIALFEFRRFFKWKQELLGLLMVAAGYLLFQLWPVITAKLQTNYPVAIEAALLSNSPDASSAQLPILDGFVFTLIDSPLQPGDNNDYAAVLSADFKLTVAKAASWQQKLQKGLQQWQQQRLLAALPLNAEQQQLLHQLPKLPLAYTQQDEQAVSYHGFASAVLILLAIGVFSSFAYFISSITAEKQQRVTEQLLTIIPASQWLDGKILGISLLSVKAIATNCLWALIIALFYSQSKGITLASLTPAWPVLLSTLLWVFSGLLLVNLFLAAFAATIDDPNHSSRNLVMLLPLVPIGLAFSVNDNAEGLLMQLLSWFPLTSFAAMPMRLCLSEVPWWEVAGAFALMLAFTYWLRQVGQRLFLLGIRMYGKEPAWSDILALCWRRLD